MKFSCAGIGTLLSVAILRIGMRCRQPDASFAEEFFPEGSFAVFGLHQTTPLQQWNDSLDEIREGAGRGDVAKIEAVHPKLDPLLKYVREAFGSSRDHAASPFHEVAQGPFAA